MASVTAINWNGPASLIDGTVGGPAVQMTLGDAVKAYLELDLDRRFRVTIQSQQPIYLPGWQLPVTDFEEDRLEQLCEELPATLR